MLTALRAWVGACLPRAFPTCVVRGRHGNALGDILVRPQRLGQQGHGWARPSPVGSGRPSQHTVLRGVLWEPTNRGRTFVGVPGFPAPDGENLLSARRPGCPGPGPGRVLETRPLLAWLSLQQISLGPGLGRRFCF